MKSEEAKQLRGSISNAIIRWNEAEDLLNQIWIDLGPYGEGKLQHRTLTRLQNFQNFDDSE